MTPLIISQFAPQQSFSLGLQTSERNDIINQQFTALTQQDIMGGAAIEKQYPLAKFKENLTPVYNCHGLTFASKRTWIYLPSEVEKILKDDKYIEIKSENDVLPGDVVIYYDNDGASHSGMVIQVDLPATLHDLVNIVVLSKWGRLKEVIHNVNYSPYSLSITKKYWRINHGFKIV